MTEEQEANYQKWIAALRSGKYRQGFGNIECDGTFCAFGVANMAISDRGGGYHLDLTETLGMRRNDGVHAILKLNDELKLPFPAIADEIEKHKSEWFESPVLAGT